MERRPLASVRPAVLTDRALTESAATSLADAVRFGALSAEEIATTHLARIAEIDQILRSVVHVDAEGVLDQARAVDRMRLAGAPLGPLAGVPFVVKDNIDVGGQTTSAGSRALDGVIALHDAVVIRRLRSAGAILLARTNMDELAMGASTRTSAFGPTRNPWDVRRSPGGSSGGSAAAVAAGLASFAVGTDTGGSIREPAAQCGVVGMAPSSTLVPRNGLIPFAPRLDRIGPLTRSVRDASEVLAVMAGRPEIAVTPWLPERPRLGLVREMFGPENQPGVLQRVRMVTSEAERLGWDLVEVSVPEVPDALNVYRAVTSAACVRHVTPYVGTGRVGDEVRRRWELGRALLGPRHRELVAAQDQQGRLAESVEAALVNVDALLSPTLPTTAPVLHGPEDPDPADPGSVPYSDCWTVVANLTGMAAVSIPAGVSPQDGMSVGVQLAAGPGSDSLLLGLAAALESSTVPLGMARL